MKTQIITLEAHDDLISVRDRMSWAKSPRILLIWPLNEQVPLRPLDLRILQQHAAGLGAQLGLVTRRGGIKRDAAAFGIPVFGSSAEAQRGPWSRRDGRRWRRARGRRSAIADLRGMKEQLGGGEAPVGLHPVIRIAAFVLAVIAVFSTASLFVPRATVVLQPITREQSTKIAIGTSLAGDSGVLAGGVLPQSATIEVDGTRTMRVESLQEVPKERAAGTAQFENLTSSPVVIPRGTVVYSAAPSAVRLVTLMEAQLESGPAASVDVPIEALDAGEMGNLPAHSVRGIEGLLSASIAVTNPEPITGGQDAVENVPSQADRDGLRALLLDELLAEAESGLQGQLGEDVMLPGTLMLASIIQESFDPPAGRPGSVLTFSMSAKYTTSYVRGADLQRLAKLALNASMPPGFVARADTLKYSVTPSPASSDGSTQAFELLAEQTIMRALQPPLINGLVRGKAPREALDAMQTALPLAATPEIRMFPSWWPWLPLIPFRIDVVVL